MSNAQIGDQVQVRWPGEFPKWEDYARIDNEDDMGYAISMVHKMPHRYRIVRYDRGLQVVYDFLNTQGSI